MTILTFVAAMFPALGFALLVWWWRRHDRRVLGTLVFTVLWGAVVATSLTLVAEPYVSVGAGAGRDTSAAVDAILVSPLLEEALKAVVMLFLLRLSRIETALEGLLVGAAVGLGFAATENYLSYVVAYRAEGVGGWVANIAVRTSLTAVMHACATASAGAVIGHLAGRSELTRWVGGPLLGYLAATLIHMGFNGGLIASDASQGLLSLLVVSVVLCVLVGVARWAVAAEAMLLRGQLLVEASLHETLTPSEVRAVFGRGVDPAVEHAAKRLALLVVREERNPSTTGSPRREEIRVLRRQLSALSHDASLLPGA